MNQFPYLYPHSLSEAERLNEEELWQDNRDAEVSHTQLTEMFRHSDPAALMDEAEQAQLAELDDTVTVYRGVTTINSDNLLALSWTLDYETADWFARRFDEDGTVYKAQIDKEHIFALFNGRDESEVVLDPKYLKDITQAQEPMTEIELNEKITNLLSENPTQQKQSRRPYARENRVKKDDRLLRIIQRYYIPHAGYVDCGFDSTTLLHSGKYIKYPKHSHCQRWMKRLTSKKTRRCTDLVRKGNEYRRLFDYWWTLY